MHDSRIEDLLRHALRSEAESLSIRITVDQLERRRAERRRIERIDRARLVAAGLAVLAVTGGLAILSQTRGELPPVAATPSPLASPAVTLPDASGLLVRFPEATVRIEQSVGPADRPIGSGATSDPGASPAPIEAGRVQLTGPFVIGIACLGDGELVVSVVAPGLGVTYFGASAPCDGRPVYSEYLSAPIDPESAGDIVSVTVSPGASWRLALGEYPATLSTPPAFAPVGLTAGWNLVSNAGPVLLSPTQSRTGARVVMPDDATRAGVFVQCQDAGHVSVSVAGASPTDVDCDETGSTRRLEFPAVGGRPLTVEATGDGGQIWTRLIVEADAELASTYPSAPPMPAAVAAVPYVAPDASVVGFGTIGSNHQTILPIQNARPGRPSGDLLPIAVFDEVDGARLDLVSVADGTVLRTLASAPAPSMIFDSWADAAHDQVFYAVAEEAGLAFHRVTVLGSDDEVITTIGRDNTGFTADLSADDAVFVIDACYPEGGCSRTVVDRVTGDVRHANRNGDPVCRILGIVDGLIVATSRETCTADATTDLIAVPIDGGDRRTLMADVPRPEIGSAVVVATDDGPKVVAPSPVGPDGSVTIDVIDVRTGEATTLPAASVVGGVYPSDVRLPGGWVLLAGGLGDFPWQRAFERPVPVLVNLVTGERIELVNLPNWEANLPG